MRDENEEVPCMLDILVEANRLGSRLYATDTGGGIALGKRDDLVSSGAEFRH